MIFFIIPAHNEEAHIGATVRSLHDAARAAVGDGEYQIIVAADACTDRTAKIASELGAAVIPVSLRQISAVRNAGAREALRRSTSPQDLFFFVDADTKVPKETFRAALGALRAGAAGGGSSARFDGPVSPAAGLLLKVFLVLFRLARLAGGCFIFCTRAAFEATGGWDERLFAGEEVYLCGALKRQGRFVVLRESVVTSGRKLRDHGVGELALTLARLALLGRRAVSSRRGLEIWYGPASSANPTTPGANRPLSR